MALPPVQASQLTPLQHRLYQGSWVITTAALTALSYHSFPQFAGAGVLGTLGCVVFYNRAVKSASTSNEQIRAWTVISSLFASSIAAACVLRSPTELLSGLQDLRNFRLESSLGCLMMFPLVAGYGIPIAHYLYKRGLEILEKAQFVPMEFYRSQTPEYKNMVSLFLDKCVFALGAIAPEGLKYLGEYVGFFGRVEVMTLPFCSVERAHQLILKLQSICERYPPKQARLLWETALSYVFIQNQKWDLLPTIVEQANQMPEDIRAEFADASIYPPDVKLRIEQKQKEITEGIQAKIEDFKKEIQALKEGLQQGNPDQETLLDEKGQKILKALRSYFQDVKTFTPDLPTQELKECLKSLQEGEIHLKLQQIRSKKNAALGGFDGDQDTWEYFLSIEEERKENEPPPYRNYKKLLTLFKIPFHDDLSSTQDPLDAALKEKEIETMAKFVAKVLNNKPELLKDPAVVLNHLEIYLKDDRISLYQKLAGQASEKANTFLFVTARITYLATMVLAALAPILTYPRQTVKGFFASLPYYASPSLQDILGLTLLFHPGVRSIAQIFRTATRRPLIDLFRGHPALMDTYDTAPLLGKLRILGTELFYASLLMDTKSAAGYVSGGAIGREVWGRRWPQNVRREYFI